jgi:hypothetical protein
MEQRIKKKTGGKKEGRKLDYKEGSEEARHTRWPLPMQG